MGLRFRTLHQWCIVGKASKTLNPIFSRAFTFHCPTAEFNSSASQSEDIPNCVDPILLALLQQHGSEDTSFILNKLISSCAKTTCLDMGIQLHSRVIKMGFNSNIYINSALLDMYGKCGVISCAQKVFDEMPHRNHVSWNSLMAAYLQSGKPRAAINLFTEMLKGEEMRATAIALSVILVCCAQLGAGDLGAQLHGYSWKVGLCLNVVVGTGLIDMYAKCSSINHSRTVFSEMPEKNVITWTSLVTGYAQNQQSSEAMYLVREMLRLGHKPSDVTYTSLLSSFDHPDDLIHCKQVHCHIIRDGLEFNTYLTVTLVTVVSRCYNSLEDFCKICSAVKIWDQVAWSAVIAGFSNLGNDDEAVTCFSEMRQAGISVDFFTFLSILRAAGVIAALEVGKQVHSLVVKTGYGCNVNVQNGLISMYSRCGEITDAEKLFQSIRTPDLVSWNSLISGYANHGYGDKAVNLFEDMKIIGIRPDLTTYLAVLSACSHVGLVEKGLGYFDMMTSDKSFFQPPKLEHYACVVDLYARAGCLLEAEAFINSMPIDPGPSVFKALISACLVRNNTEIAVRSARKLVELYPNDPAAYVLAANSLADGGHWDNAAGMRQFMCDKGVMKKPASSWV